MLKKKCPPWGPAQTETIKQVEVIAQSPPPLQIPTTGQHILQTNASDDYWSAILFEEINDVRHFCAHASGQFKYSEKNYHVIYKEILAVKYGRTKSQHVHYSLHCSQTLLPTARNKRLLDTRYGLWMEDLSPSLYTHPWHNSYLCSQSIPHGTQQCSATCHKHSPHICWTIPHLRNNSKDISLYPRFQFKSTRNSCHGTTSRLH